MPDTNGRSRTNANARSTRASSRADAEHNATPGPRETARPRRGGLGFGLFALSLLLLAASGFILTFAAGRRALASDAISRAALPSAASAAQGGGQKFSHAVAQHAAQSCDSCHHREGNDAQPRLPGHKACIDCHVTQFTTSQTPLCMNCHTSVESNNPPLKSFPGLTDFGMRFDHAQHMSGSAHPEQGCTACHQPARRGVALSIPAGLAAHNNCYQCHTPNAQGPSGRQIGSCNTCHALGGYGRASTAAAAYRVNFSHAGHGARQGLRCDDCHQVRSGVPRTQQVTAPQATQHFGTGRAQNCMTCHNDRRAFGGDNFADCKRCHTGQTFRF